MDDLLLLDDSGLECRVTAIDNVTDRFTVLSPNGILLQFNYMDLEVMELPRDDRALLEQWLRCSYRIVPQLRVKDQILQCRVTCGCRYCYQVVRTHEVSGRSPWITRHHFVDNNTCCMHHVTTSVTTTATISTTTSTSSNSTIACVCST